MTAIRATPPGQGQPDPGQLPRLVTPGPPTGLAAHLNRHGPIPALAGPALIASIERAGLTGRGGAGFPAARKMRAVTAAASRPPGRGRWRGSTPVVLANGAESEPASGKDTILLRQSPHLVLDGIALAAQAVGGTNAYLCVAGSQPAGALLAAVAERQRAGLPGSGVRVVAIPRGYVASEESALVSYLSGGPAVPRYVPPRPAERGVGGRPTLVHNVETLAHIALIARYGPDWFAAVGTPGAPGSALVTIGGAVHRPGVYEIALGRPVTELIGLAGGVTEPAQAVLAGGYFGGWLPLPGAADVPVSPSGLRAAGAAFGSGLLTVLPATSCVLAETARILRYLAGQSAGQCGPCTFGLPAIADALAQLAWQGRDRRAADWLQYLLPVVANRGACHLPDGAVAVAASAIRSFGQEIEQHVAHGPCANASRPSVLPLPRTAPAGRP